MWDDEGNEALFDQSGNFRDQEDFERFVEEYTPLSSLHPDDIDDVANTFNVDFERIGNTYLGAGRGRFNTDFDAKISALWHFWGGPGMQIFKSSLDPLVRAAVRDYYRQAGLVSGNGHPETCNCPECELLYDYPEYMVRSLPSDNTPTRAYHDEDTSSQVPTELVYLAPVSPASLDPRVPVPPPPAIQQVASEQSASDPRRLGWFARLVRPWSWIRRRR